MNLKKLTFLPLMVVLTVSSFSQDAPNSQMQKLAPIFAAGDDASVLIQEYITPMGNAIGAGLNSGWYNTAKPHELGGFDLTFTFHSVMIPKNANTYNLDNLNLNANIQGNTREVPTISGAKDADVPTLMYSENGNDININAPQGRDLRFMFIPMAKIGIGLIKETEIAGRFVPTINYGEAFGGAGSVGLWGVGLKHGLKQYIPFIKRAPLLHLTVQAGYTRLTTTQDIQVDYADLNLNESNDAALDLSNQQAIMQVGAFTSNLLFSIDAPVFTAYVGVGLSTSSANFKMTGNYPVNRAGGIPDVTTDPVNIKIKNTDGSLTNPRLNGGTRLKLGVLTFHFDYTYANYSVFTGGFGISFR